MSRPDLNLNRSPGGANLDLERPTELEGKGRRRRGLVAAAPWGERRSQMGSGSGGAPTRAAAVSAREGDQCGGSGKSNEAGVANLGRQHGAAARA